MSLKSFQKDNQKFMQYTPLLHNLVTVDPTTTFELITITPVEKKKQIVQCSSILFYFIFVQKD